MQRQVGNPILLSRCCSIPLEDRTESDAVSEWAPANCPKSEARFHPSSKVELLLAYIAATHGAIRDDIQGIFLKFHNTVKTADVSSSSLWQSILGLEFTSVEGLQLHSSKTYSSLPFRRWYRVSDKTVHSTYLLIKNVPNKFSDILKETFQRFLLLTGREPKHNVSMLLLIYVSYVLIRSRFRDC